MFKNEEVGSFKNAQFVFSKNEVDEFEAWLKKTSRKTKKLIRRIMRKGPSICQTFGLEDYDPEIILDIPKDGKLYKKLTKCSNDMVRNKVKNANIYSYPVFISWKDSSHER